MRLTDSEIRALKLVSLGYTSREAADVIECKKRTVDFHLGNAYKKLEARNRVEAIAKAQSLGILTAPGVA